MTSPTLATMLRTRAEGTLDTLPYGKLMGLTFRHEDDDIHIHMPFALGLIGAPGRLHGGAIAGLLEIAALARVITALPQAEHWPRIRPITLTVDFMRGGTPEPATASAEITRLGRRIVNVTTRAWQSDPTKPIAAANVNFLLDYPAAKGSEPPEA